MYKKRIFYWEGYTQSGKKVKGRFFTNDINQAKEEFLQEGIYLTQLRLKKYYLPLRKKISAKELIFFTRQLAILLSAGLALLPSLKMIQKISANLLLQALVTTMGEQLKNGLPFYKILEKNPKLFSPLYCSLIKIGEHTGKLENSLNSIAIHLEKQAEIKRLLQKTLSYPALVLIVAIFVLMILLLVVMPNFINVYESFQAEIPIETQLVINFASFLKFNWHYLLLITNTFLLLLVYLYKQKISIKKFIDGMIIRLPLIGPFYLKIISMQMLNILSTTLHSGLPLLLGLTICSNFSKNYQFQYCINTIIDDIKQGHSFSSALKKTYFFPPLVSQMSYVGEQSSQLEQVFTKIADSFAADLELSINHFANLLEPMILLFLSLVIGFFVLAMYLPVIKLGSIF